MHIDPQSIPEVAMAFMQETHLEEVALLNGLYLLFDQFEAGEEVPGLEAQVEALASHTHAHFAREEERMLKLDFPPYPIHKMAHDEYLEAFDGELNSWRSSGDVAPVITFLRETTPGWMQQHISTMDFVTANFFAMHQ